MEVFESTAQLESEEQNLKTKEEILEAIAKRRVAIRELREKHISLNKEIDKLLNKYKDSLPIKVGDKVKVTMKAADGEQLEKIGYVTCVCVQGPVPAYYVLWANKNGSRPARNIGYRYIVYEESSKQSIERLAD